MFAIVRSLFPKSVLLTAGLLAGFVAMQPQSVSFVSEASAQSHHRSGVILGGSKRHHHKRIVPAYRDPALNRLGFRKSGSLTHGKRYRHANRKHGYYKRGDIQFVERRRKIDAYNRSLRKERAGVVYRNRPYGNSIYLPYERQGIITSGYSDTGVAGPVVRSTEPCPSHHNCGYRLYDDGTGPRIITPGVSAGGHLPQFDGLSGPRVITLGD